MNAAKIRLSQKELELVMNADWILTKNDILQKTIQLLAALQTRQQEYLQSYAAKLPAAIIRSTPKISKGENYKGLPYQVLDYPRIFEQENIFTIRTIFWWGNFFSTTLQLSGSYKKLFAEKIIAGYNILQEKQFSYCINENQWEHHFEESNYLPISGTDKSNWENLVHEKDFHKISGKVSLHQWDDAEDILFDHFKHLVSLLAD